MTETPRSLSIFRAEGVLWNASGLGCAAWIAARRSDWGGRFAGLAARVLTPGAAQVDGSVATQLAWRSLAGCSEDRLVVLAELYREDRLVGHENAAGHALLARCRDRGDVIVIVSDHPDVALGDLPDRLGAEVVVCNRLVVARNEVTGALHEPIVTGRLDAGAVRRLAVAHGVDPTRVNAYGATAADATLLAAVTFPCAVTPDFRLRRLASTFDWPVVEAP